MEITVLRLNHRPYRDKRLTSHLALTARAFGAQKFVYTGIEDKSVEASITKIVDQWGGPFTMVYSKDYHKILSNWEGAKIHLTMYGLPFQKVLTKIQNVKNDVILIVGGPKVPGDIYGLVDWNISVTSQPHSEVGAVAVFLHEYFERKELDKEFRNFKMKIVPTARGKNVEKIKNCFIDEK
jgi:tRNA (cytidine56-2'-O)-methyltransferase